MTSLASEPSVLESMMSYKELSAAYNSFMVKYAERSKLLFAFVEKYGMTGMDTTQEAFTDYKLLKQQIESEIKELEGKKAELKKEVAKLELKMECKPSSVISMTSLDSITSSENDSDEYSIASERTQEDEDESDGDEDEEDRDDYSFTGSTRSSQEEEESDDSWPLEAEWNVADSIATERTQEDEDKSDGDEDEEDSGDYSLTGSTQSSQEDEEDEEESDDTWPLEAEKDSTLNSSIETAISETKNVYVALMEKIAEVTTLQSMHEEQGRKLLLLQDDFAELEENLEKSREDFRIICNEKDAEISKLQLKLNQLEHESYFLKDQNRRCEAELKKVEKAIKAKDAFFNRAAEQQKVKIAYLMATVQDNRVIIQNSIRQLRSVTEEKSKLEAARSEDGMDFQGLYRELKQLAEIYEEWEGIKDSYINFYIEIREKLDALGNFEKEVNPSQATKKELLRLVKSEKRQDERAAKMPSEPEDEEFVLAPENQPTAPHKGGPIVELADLILEIFFPVAAFIIAAYCFFVLLNRYLTPARRY